MKIVFICGSLEQGRDGVGDYVRRLSIEVSIQGHEVGLAAINDRHIKIVEKNKIETLQGDIEILRLPEGMNNQERFDILTKWTKEQNADWHSLQFVPFSFNRRGFIFGLAKNLLRLGQKEKWHIMFHELWLGMDSESGNKELFWGICQRYLINNLLKCLKPTLIHTHVNLYRRQLAKLGVEVKLLPLFSNIPVISNVNILNKWDWDDKEKAPIDLVTFGGIHAGAPIGELATEAAKYGKDNNIIIRLVIIGKSGAGQADFIREWEAVGLTAIPLGEQTEAEVSVLLSEAKYGIFTTPIALVEKSGSVAAMRDHGIHLLCASREWNPRGIDLEPNPFSIKVYKPGNLASFFESKPDFTNRPTLVSISQQFISDLNSI